MSEPVLPAHPLKLSTRERQQKAEKFNESKPQTTTANNTKNSDNKTRKPKKNKKQFNNYNNTRNQSRTKHVSTPHPPPIHSQFLNNRIAQHPSPPISPPAASAKRLPIPLRTKRGFQQPDASPSPPIFSPPPLSLTSPASNLCDAREVPKNAGPRAEVPASQKQKKTKQ